MMHQLLRLLPRRVSDGTQAFPARFEHSAPLWQRTLVMELCCLVFSRHELLRDWHSDEVHQSGTSGENSRLSSVQCRGR